MTIEKLIDRFVQDVTKTSINEPLNGDEVQNISSRIRVALDWNNGNLSTKEYNQQLAHIRKYGYV